ncbi:hypothetical protein RB195_011065 [Necator americanus]|uniref:C2H2-type domain-containing protein n=1 Tax=Necator americanus TaxID=51031 RepID=A0ABR1D3X7_NECAM
MLLVSEKKRNSSKEIEEIMDSIQRNWPSEESTSAKQSSEIDRIPHVDSMEATLLPLSEIQTLAEKPVSASKRTANISKKSSRPSLRRREPVHSNNKNRTRIILSQTPLPKIPKTMAPVPPQTSHSHLVSEAIALATSKGLRGGYIEFLRSNTDESIKRSFDEVKKELTNRQSFLKSATSVVRYLQAARILYNRLDWKERRKYEYAARDRARMEHTSDLQRKGVEDEMPLFINETQTNEKEVMGKNACNMPPSEHLLKDRRSLEDFRRYEACKSRRIHCPLCSLGSERLTNAVHYQGHMLEHHSCAYLFACHFCGLVFPSLDALKAHDGCEEFATALVQRINSSGELEFQMNFATLIMVCTDCGSQLLIRASYIGESSISHWNDIVDFHMLHNAEKLVPLVIYSHEDFTVKMRLRIQTMTSAIKGIQMVCPHCQKSDFDSVDALESHFLSHEESIKRLCPECKLQFSQEAFFREHLLSHLGTKACYLALHLSRICTFITGGVPSCGPNLSSAGALIYGGVSSAVFNSKLSMQFIDVWESSTVRKKSNRRDRKRRSGPACKKDPDEVEDDPLPTDEAAAKLRKLLGDSFDCEGVLRLNSFFYTAVNSKDETEESSRLYNSVSTEYECLVEDRSSGTGTKLADDIARKFSRNCRLAGGKTLSKKHNPSHIGLFSKILMCRRCHCVCVGVKAVFAHLSLCCPELRCDENSQAPFDLDNDLLVFCVYTGNGVPNTRIKCWECSTTVCSVLGLRIHMIVDHGIFLKVEYEPPEAPDLVDDRPAFFSVTSRTINKAIGLTENGSLPVNLEERRKEALMAKMKNQNVLASSPSHFRPATGSPASSTTPHPRKVKSPKKNSTPAACTGKSPVVIFDEASPPSVQILHYMNPPSVQILENENQPSAASVSNGFTELTIEEREIEHGMNGANCVPILDTGTFVTEDVQVFEVSGSSSDHCSRDEAGNKPVSSLPISEPALSSNNEQQKYGDPSNNTTANDVSQVDEVLEETPECELCGLTLRSHDALRKHYKLHTEITSTCYLCDPPCSSLDTAELYLDHIHIKHTTPLDLNKEDFSDYAVCSFCDFNVRKSQVFQHLISDCYMAPCLICGDKLPRKNDRISHRRTHRAVFDRFMCECRRGFSHFSTFAQHQCRTKTLLTVTCTGCDLKFAASLNGGRAKVLGDSAEHFIKEHTKDLHCMLCNNEPLEALREHVLSHLTESSEVCTPERSLLTCKNIDMFVNTTEENLCVELRKSLRERKRSRKGGGSGSEQDTNELMETSDADSAPSVTLEDNTGDEDIVRMDILEESQMDDFHPVEGSNSRDGNSPSVLEKQRQVLAGLLDDLGPPPSVIIIENEAAVIREEREEPQSAVPKSSVADDGEDDILVIDEMGEPLPPSLSTSSLVVHTVNEGDDDLMMLSVVELPTGSISHSIASTREKKYKCSMCSETFLRESTCRHHEQNSHRNDIVSDTCDEVYGVPLGMECFMYLCQQCAVAFEDPQRARKHLAQHMVKGPAFPCEKCSSICLTDSNLRDHHKKHDSGKLSYRCLKCNPNKIYCSESAIYFHLYIEHSVPIIAFCKNCLVGSANLDRIFAHTIMRECSGGNKESPRASLQTLLRSLGFAIASELYFQPNDEAAHKQAEAMKRCSTRATQSYCFLAQAQLTETQKADRYGVEPISLHPFAFRRSVGAQSVVVELVPPYLSPSGADAPLQLRETCLPFLPSDTNPFI